jgi:hypothetical protein
MGIEDKRISRILEHELYRFQSLDITEAKVTVVHAIGYVGGILRPSKEVGYLDMKNEVRILQDHVKRIPGLNSLVVDAKLINEAKKR